VFEGSALCISLNRAHAMCLLCSSSCHPSAMTLTAVSVGMWATQLDRYDRLHQPTLSSCHLAINCWVQTAMLLAAWST
jgi:hypothetical protein